MTKQTEPSNPPGSCANPPGTAVNPPVFLRSCPFCGAGTTQFRENGKTWTGQRYGEPASVSVMHWCEPVDGQPSRSIERVGRDHASAVEAWNRRAPNPTPEGCGSLPAGVLINAYAIATGTADRLGGQVTAHRVMQRQGPDLWAVRRDGNCLSKDGRWEWEPMPSGRDDEFLARCRFDTPEQAIAAALAATSHPTPKDAP